MRKGGRRERLLLPHVSTLLAWYRNGENVAAKIPLLSAYLGHATAYRNALRLLLVFAAGRTGTPPSQLDIADLDAALIGAFLTHLEQERGNSVATRNARLAAIRTLFAYAALRHPEDAEVKRGSTRRNVGSAL